MHSVSCVLHILRTIDVKQFAPTRNFPGIFLTGKYITSLFFRWKPLAYKEMHYQATKINSGSFLFKLLWLWILSIPKSMWTFGGVGLFSPKSNTSAIRITKQSIVAIVKDKDETSRSTLDIDRMNLKFKWKTRL